MVALPGRMHLFGAMVAASVFALTWLIVSASPVIAAKPALDGPNCSGGNGAGTVCDTALPPHGPAPALLHWEWTGCSSARSSDDIPAPGKDYQLHSVFGEGGTYLVQVFAKNGNMLYAGTAATPCP